MEPKAETGVEGIVNVEELQPSKVSATQSVKDKVKSRLATENPEIKDKVVSKMVEEEKGKRVTILEQAFKELTRLEGDLLKLIPDMAFLQVGGEETKAYSKETLEKRNKLKDSINKLEAAFNKAVGEKDWSNLKQIVDNLPKGQ